MFALSRFPALAPRPYRHTHYPYVSCIPIPSPIPHPRRDTTTSNPSSPATTRRDESRNSQLVRAFRPSSVYTSIRIIVDGFLNRFYLLRERPFISRRSLILPVTVTVRERFLCSRDLFLSPFLPLPSPPSSFSFSLSSRSIRHCQISSAQKHVGKRCSCLTDKFCTNENKERTKRQKEKGGMMGGGVKKRHRRKEKEKRNRRFRFHVLCAP